MAIKPKKDRLSVMVYSDTLREARMLSYMQRREFPTYIEEALRAKNKYERARFTRDGAIEPEPEPAVPEKPTRILPKTH